MLGFDELDNIAQMNETTDGYNVSYVEDAKYVYKIQKHVARLSGYFVAPDNGKFTFYIKGKQVAKMYLTAQNNRVSTDCDKMDKYQLYKLASSCFEINDMPVKMSYFKNSTHVCLNGFVATKLHKS